MTLAYAELTYNTEAYNALKADLANNPTNFFVAVSVNIADITRGDELVGNASAFTAPDAVLGYFVSYDDTLTNLEVFNVSSFTPITDLNEWKKNKTLA